MGVIQRPRRRYLTYDPLRNLDNVFACLFLTLVLGEDIEKSKNPADTNFVSL